MKLELKHLAPYLPYELKIQINSHDDGGNLPWQFIGILTGYQKRNEMYTIIDDSKEEWNFHDIHFNDKSIQPILRPLSDLTKEIEHNGRKFVPYETNILVEFMTVDDTMDCLCENSHDISTNIDIPYYIIIMLIEWHFDVFGLIEQNLAITK